MAADFNKPVVGDNYTNVLQYIRDNFGAALCWLDPGSAPVSGAANIPTGAKRINSTNGLIESFNGSSWAELSVAYMKSSGGTATGLITAGAGIDVTGGNIRMRSQLKIRFDAEDGSHKWSILQSATASNNDFVIYDQSRSATVLSIASADGYINTIAGMTVGGNLLVSGAGGITTTNFHSTGASGWVNDTYGGGIYMADSQYVRTAGSKGILGDAGANNWYAGYFTADDGRFFGKVVLVETTNGAGTDGPQLHFRHMGTAEWGFGMEESNGVGLAMYYGGNTVGWGTKRFRFGELGYLQIFSDFPQVILTDVDSSVTRTLYANGGDVGFLLSGGTYGFRSGNDGSCEIPSGYLSIGRSSLANVNTGSWGGQLEVKNNSSGGAAKITFHRQGGYAMEAGLDSDNVFRIGGGSDGANYRAQFDTSGNLTTRGTITGTVVTQTSDRDLKTNIRPLMTDAAMINGLAAAAAEFDWKHELKPDSGFIAQAVYLAEPLAVHRRDDGYLTINVVPIVAHLAVHAADVERRLQRLEAAA